ncbi:MAG: type II/IV secretion system ATPase subunit [Candidatus Thermoplasmatota archaeon]|nr:type II/IV secretion system ATPase subunit [Candidatus Thermoplasmatota archaeon]
MTQMQPDEVQQLLQKSPHLKKYVEQARQHVGNPVFYSVLPYNLRNEPYPNVIYPARGAVFVHAYRTADMNEIIYRAIEPKLTKIEKQKHDKLLKTIVKKAPEKKSVSTDDELRAVLKELIDELIIVDERAKGLEEKKKTLFNRSVQTEKIRATSLQKRDIEYAIIKNLIGGGPLEPFMRDPYLEDIHLIPGEHVHLIHKIFGMIKTNVEINADDAPLFARKISEKMESPVSEGQPIADGVLPDGSRGNVIYSKDISIKGPSMTIRKFTETPISITQLIKWGTLSAGIGAYLWLCIQYGRSFFMCGETASGKTTTLNASLPFIPPNKKVYTAEETPELHVPHVVWQQLLTKTTGPEEGRVDLFDLLKAALRSRPDYIVPGEVRGAEGNIVFQAMQTGHPCMTTFHASDITKVIQRFTGDPINVPKTFMDNLDFVMIQLSIEQKGKKIRRCISLEEIEGYNRETDSIMARRAFDWNPVEDRHIFRANRNSFILEEKIAKNAGYADTTEIYDEYDRRKHILERMVEEDIMDYYEVVQFIWTFYREGEKGLPISI